MTVWLLFTHRPEHDVSQFNPTQGNMGFHAAAWNSKFRCELTAAIALNCAAVLFRSTFPTRQLFFDCKF